MGERFLSALRGTNVSSKTLEEDEEEEEEDKKVTAMVMTRVRIDGR